MLRFLFALNFLLASAFALAQQQTSPQSLNDQLNAASRLLESGRVSEAERLYRQLIPRPEDQSLEGLSLFSGDIPQDLLWALTGYSYLGANDYANAERLGSERLRAAETKGTGHTATYITLLAETYRLQGKYAQAYPMYSQLNQLWFSNQLPADFQKQTQLGMVECLIVRGQNASAEMAARPAVDADGSYVGPKYHEDDFNTYVVTLEQNGHKPEAAKLEEKIDAESYLVPAANQQSRDLLRARLLSARKADASAEVLYQKWTGYWKTAPALANVDPRTSLHIRTRVLTEYSHFLSVHGRVADAKALQAQLVAMGCSFGLCE